MAPEEFLIKELAKRANTTVRTIRYYTNEGLLPQPSSQGKYALYTQTHLDRLELIRRLKEAFLPLREIRSIMLSLTDEEVREHLQEHPPAAEADASADLAEPGDRAGAQALEYLAQIRDSRIETLSLESPDPAQRSPFKERENIEMKAFKPHNASTPPLTGESWRRVVFDEGVELHYSEAVDRQKAGLIQQLVAYGMKLFAPKKKAETNE
jgi:DNA-binding transcriptional MerR regulator